MKLEEDKDIVEFEKRISDIKEEIRHSKSRQAEIGSRMEGITLANNDE